MPTNPVLMGQNLFWCLRCRNNIQHNHIFGFYFIFKRHLSVISSLASYILFNAFVCKNREPKIIENDILVPSIETNYSDCVLKEAITINPIELIINSLNRYKIWLVGKQFQYSMLLLAKIRRPKELTIIVCSKVLKNYSDCALK